MIIVVSFITIALLMMLATVLHNLLSFPRLSDYLIDQPLKTVTVPGVSILIPARNEAGNIGQTVTKLLQQTYPNFELLVLDDHSDDDTGAIATTAANADPRFRLLRGTLLPTDWAGKNWACHQLADAARYNLLLFTDADVIWQPTALAAVIQLQQATDADLLTVWPTQMTVTWGERLVVPLMSFAIWAYLPVWLVHRTPHPAAAAANGQCLLFQCEIYNRIGGHGAIRGQVLDDVLLAQRVKASGGRLRMADGAGLIGCRMYQNWRETLYGYAKNILAGHNQSPLFLIASTIFHLIVFVGPWLWLMAGFVVPTPYWPIWPLILVMLTLLVRLLSGLATAHRWFDAFLMPLSVLMMTRIALQSLWWYWHDGAPQWKGRILPSG